MLRAVKNIYHFIQGFIAVAWYGFPSRRLKVIGVTGTDGKTTTTSLIYHILKSAGKKVSMISTVYAQIGGTVYDTGFHVTTPSRFVVQKYLKMAADHGDEFFVLEVTSHALDQHRVWGTEFDLGLITNVTHEHLDYHKTYENYVKAKSELFKMAKIAVVNKDDESYALLIRELAGKFETRNSKSELCTTSHNNKEAIITYGLKEQADFQLDLSTKLGQTLAEFNKYNYLSAYIVARQYGLKDEEIFQAMKTFQLPPGRIETVYDKEFKVIVDFAHTPNAIDKLLQTLRQETITGRLIHIFSSAARRDESKRPLMGAASGKYADLIILTEEDYRDDDPYKINKEIAAGMKPFGVQEVAPSDFGKVEGKAYTIIVDRQKAVEKALEIAQRGDVIVLTGKGHEKSLCRGNKEYPWNDKEAVLKEIEKK